MHATCFNRERSITSRYFPPKFIMKYSKIQTSQHYLIADYIYSNKHLQIRNKSVISTMIHVNSISKDNSINETIKKQAEISFQQTLTLWKNSQTSNKILKKNFMPRMDLKNMIQSRKREQFGQLNQTRSIFLLKGDLLPYLQSKQKNKQFDEEEGEKISDFYVSNYQGWNYRGKQKKDEVMEKTERKKQAQQIRKNNIKKREFKEPKTFSQGTRYKNSTLKDSEIPLTQSFAKALNVYKKRQAEKSREPKIAKSLHQSEKQESTSPHFNKSFYFKINTRGPQPKIQKPPRQIILGNRTIIHEKQKKTKSIQASNYQSLQLSKQKPKKKRLSKIHKLLLEQADRCLTPWSNDVQAFFI